MNPYNLVEVRFATATSAAIRKVIVHARPVAFVFDDAGQPIRALKLVTTCPGCGALNEMDVSDVTIIEGIVLESVCTLCSGVPDAPVLKPKPVEKKVEEKQPAVLIKQDLLKNDRQEAGILGKELVDVNDDGFTTNGVFVDPIALGNFEIENI